MPANNGVRPGDVERVPAHVGNFQIRVARADRRDIAGNPIEARRRFHARARATPSTACRRKCRGTAGRAGARRPRVPPTIPGTASSPRRQSAKAPTPGSTMCVARATASGSAVNQNLVREPRLARGALEGFLSRMQIARPIVDDRDAHLSPRPREETDDFLRVRGRRACGCDAASRRREHARQKLAPAAASESAGRDDIGERPPAVGRAPSLATRDPRSR